MRLKFIIYTIASLFVLGGCDVHQWPEPPIVDIPGVENPPGEDDPGKEPGQDNPGQEEPGQDPTPSKVKFKLHLAFEPDMDKSYHTYDIQTENVTPPSLTAEETKDNTINGSVMRYTVRAYQSGTTNCEKETILEQNIFEKYDYDVDMELVPGKYDFVVWADIGQKNMNGYYYDVSNFNSLRISSNLESSYHGNTDFRDGFRGKETAAVSQSVSKVTIPMKRPMAKYEIRSTGVKEFLQSKNLTTAEGYTVKFAYLPMPVTYNAVQDVNAGTNKEITFESKLPQLNKNNGEVTLGFDYVFVNAGNQSVTIEISVYDSDKHMVGKPVQIKVPIRRNHHTVICGQFLKPDANDGVTIDPDFDGNHNVGFDDNKNDE